LLSEVPWHSWLRWCLALLLLATGTVIALLSSTGHGFQVCSDVVAQGGKQSSVRSCRSLQVTDAPVLLFLLMFVALIVPDFTRVSIAGFIDLERKVATQEQKTRALQQQVVALQTVHNSSSAQVIHADKVFLHASEDPSASITSIEEKKEVFGDW
jgi:uncharacterized coiled-coil protein SlyX